MVAELTRTRHSRKQADLPLPADPATWSDWLAEAQFLLIPVLRAADPEAPIWERGLPVQIGRPGHQQPRSATLPRRPART
jgi:hypothetical protein